MRRLEGSVSSTQIDYAQKRRSSRLDMAVPVSVRGVDAFHEAYREEVTTGNISCHGCTYRMKHEVLPGATVVLSVGASTGDYGAFAGRARVKWMQPFKT